MKLMLVLFVVVLVSCTASKGTAYDTVKQNTIAEEYLVTDLDSLNNYYIIYAKKNNIPYKIISKKVEVNCKEIQIGKSYNLVLSDNLLKKITGDSKFQPINYLDISNCVMLDDTTEVCRERYMDGLYYSDTLKGLCIIR